MLVDFLNEIARQQGAESLRGAVVLVALRRAVDDLIRYSLALGPYHRGKPSDWSHCFLVADRFSGPETPILDCTIREEESGKVLWNTDLTEFLKIVVKPSGSIYLGAISDYEDQRVSPIGVKLIPSLSAMQRSSIVSAGRELAKAGYHYDLPGLFRELARLTTSVALPSGNKLLFCSAFVQAAYRAGIGDVGDFVPASVASTDVTPDDIWFSQNGRNLRERTEVAEVQADTADGRDQERPTGLRLGRRVAVSAAFGLTSDSAAVDLLDLRSGKPPIAEIERAIDLLQARPQLYRSADVVAALRSARAQIEQTVQKMPPGANPDSFLASALLSALSGMGPTKEPLNTPLDAIDGWEQYENLDIRWVNSFIDYLKTQRDPFPTHLDSKHIDTVPIIPVEGDEITIAIAGDWGTGNRSSSSIAEKILARRPDITIHLGDVYYAGELDEERRFVSAWPSGTHPKYPAFALNSNHEMYSGGQGYFRVALKSSKFSAQQGLSYFALDLQKWIVVGLDSAYDAPHKFWELYETGRLNQVQFDWTRELTRKARGSGKRIIALTHHHGREANGEVVPVFFNQMMDAFEIDSGIRGPDLWYWGHVHGVMAFRPMRISDSVTLRARCVGHGGVPYREFSDLNTDAVEWSETVHAPPPEGERLLNGFAFLRIKGDSIEETFFDEFGRQRWPSG